MKRSSFLVLVLSLLLGALPAHARRVHSRHRRHHKMTRVRFREAPRHHSERREFRAPRHYYEAPAPPPPPAPDPAPRAITSLPLPPDEAPVAAAPLPPSPAPRAQPASVAASVAPALKPVSRIHPIILPGPIATPAVLVASGTITPSAPEATPFVRVRLPMSRPPPPPPAPIPAFVPAPAPTPTPAVARPYVLPGHALPLDEELKLVNDLNQSPWGVPATHHHAIPHFFGWLGLQIARPFRAFFHSLS